MSSLLSRSRSLRKPAGGELGQKKDGCSSPDNQSNARTVSPSRLPTASTASSRTTRTASTAVRKTEDSSGAPTSRSRPVSGVFGLGRSASVRQPTASSTTSSSTTTSRPPITTRNRPLARPTSSSGLPSSTTTAPPPRGHTRTKSSATVLTSSTILRPPSQTSTTSSSQPSIRPPASSTRTLHARQPSTSAAAPRPRSTTTTTTTTTTSTAPAAPNPSVLRKPAFTTLQQHFSPAKNLAPKPLTSTFLAPPSPSKLPTNVAISAETARLQTELLQLHLLHRDADSVSAAWHGSARRKLGRRFAHVAGEEEEEVRQVEERVWGDVNAAALRRWGRGKGGLEEKVGLLDGVLNTVWALGEKGGRYSRVVRRFETWAEGVRAVVSARETVGRRGEVVFVGDLDAGWKGDCESLRRKLGSCRDTIGLLSLGEGGESTLSRILDGITGLVEDMLAELDLMLAIEREAVRSENEWVRAVNRAGDGGDDDTPRAGAIWRGF